MRRMQIPLRQLTTTKRKRVVLRPIAPTQVLANDLYSIYADTIRIWSDLFAIIGVDYTMPEGTQDAEPRDFQAAITAANRNADQILFYQTERLGRWVTRVGNWHGAKTIAGVKSALGVDIAPYMTLSDVADILNDAVRANVALIRDVNAKNRSAVEEIIYDAQVNRRTKKEVTDALAKALGITKRRARLIANDQTWKLSIALSAARNRQMGIDTFIWRHTPQEHPRPEHVRRDGKVFRWDAPPWDGLPGYAIGCKCRSESLVEFE